VVNGPLSSVSTSHFFIAAQEHIISSRKALNWLLADENWWLWSVETQREAMRLLVVLAPQLDKVMFDELEQAITKGPPREMFKLDVESEQWKHLNEHSIWLRLAKLIQAGTTLGKNASKRFKDISMQTTMET